MCQSPDETTKKHKMNRQSNQPKTTPYLVANEIQEIDCRKSSREYVLYHIYFKANLSVQIVHLGATVTDKGEVAAVFPGRMKKEHYAVSRLAGKVPHILQSHVVTVEIEAQRQVSKDIKVIS
ncbi:hypothetical protein E5288_WYG010582 [Bos mutus]|uniref:Uncharacterized protein n=1 Tax=Bos mutus TaxID=72004 RepID=A0A6B0RZV4_9CETA|nr:hypothetical protein [Bos mutus]